MATYNGNGNGNRNRVKKVGSGNGTSSQRKKTNGNGKDPFSGVSETLEMAEYGTAGTGGNEQGGLTALSISQVSERLGAEQDKAKAYAAAVAGNTAAAADSIDTSTAAEVSLTPAVFSIEGETVDLLSNEVLFDTQKMAQVLSQVQMTTATNETAPPLNNYSNVTTENSPNLEVNASVVDLLATKNITLEKKSVTTNSDAGIDLETDPLDNFNATDVAIAKCLINHFVDPGEHLGIETHFLRENLLIEDSTKQNCNNCTVEGLEDVGTVDLSSLNGLVVGRGALETVSQLITGERQATSGGGGSTMENIFAEEAEVPIQLQALTIAAQRAGTSDSQAQALQDLHHRLFCIILVFNILMFSQVMKCQTLARK